MTANEPMPKWRNALRWAAVGFVFLALVMLGAIALLQDGGVGELLAANAPVEPDVVAILAGSLLLGSVVVGFSQRNSPLSGRTLRNYLLANVIGIALFALAGWGYMSLGGRAFLGAMDGSARVALVLGLVLVILAILSALMVAVAHTGAGLLTPEQAEDTRERARATLYSAIWLAATGLLLMLLSVSGPGGAVSPAIALVGSVVLLAIATGVSFAIWPLLDELWRALSRETGNVGYYLIVVMGGGWAILAHLGFVRAPAPLDWLTSLTLIMFAASFIAIGRRGMLQAR